MEQLDLIARRYSTRPSVLVGVTDALQAFSIDVNAAVWGSIADKRRSYRR